MSQPASNETPRGRATVVVVDDEENMCKILSRILSVEGYIVTTFTDPVRAVEYIRHKGPELVLTDLKMPGIGGMEVLRSARESDGNTSVIVMTAYGSIEGATEAMRAGAYDYVTKPFKTDELLLTLSKALERTKLGEENAVLKETLERQSGASEILGSSPAIEQVLKMVDRVAPTDSAVLIHGESGTGKELVARRIHSLSPRRNAHFVAINCASIPDTLLESELFGHEKGAFSGADRMKMGLVELAGGGTLFLDEIGELPLGLQAKLLRVLQEREIQRVGGLHTIPVDIRLLAATNRDLKAAIEAREFRQDLYYRLDVISVTLPPLRDRVGDVEVLTQYFLQQMSRRLRKPPMKIAPEAMAALAAYPFPGNVRELENIVERMVVLCPSDIIQLQDIPADIRAAAGRTPAVSAPPVTEEAQLIEYKDARDAFEREYLLKVIAAAQGNISEAARMSGISRRHFYEKLEKLGITPQR